ncbi:MAG: hypothetical protein ACOX6T_13730 [Myxococcales bacterium]|jgi:hypothetical protein
MIPKAVLILALDALAAGALGLWLRGQGWNGAGGFLSGALVGLLCGATAVAGAAFAHARSLEVRQVLTVIFGGMAGRMVLLGAWTLVSLHTLGLDAAGFAGGFGAVYLIAMGVEIWMLSSHAERLE